MSPNWRPVLRQRIPYGLMDLLVIAACCVVFVAVIGAARSMAPKSSANAVMARDPGPPTLAPSVGDHRRLVATALGIFAEPLDSALE